jgi:hypothetical protein
VKARGRSGRRFFQNQHGFLACDEKGISPAVNQILNLGIGLPLIGLKGEGKVAVIRNRVNWSGIAGTEVLFRCDFGTRFWERY